MPAIVTFIKELADYERELDKAIATEAQLHTALFGPSPALYGHMACDGETGEPVGFALWFLNFSTWRGVHGIYLEDLYVRPTARGHGYGKALLKQLAQIAVERGYWGVAWSVLDWNTPSIDFYKSLGAQAQDDWTTYRVMDDSMRALASS